MTTIESTADVPSHEEDDRLLTTQHLFDMLSFVHADVLNMTAQELHSRYVQAHDEVHKEDTQEN